MFDHPQVSGPHGLCGYLTDYADGISRISTNRRNQRSLTRTWRIGSSASVGLFGLPAGRRRGHREVSSSHPNPPNSRTKGLSPFGMETSSAWQRRSPSSKFVSGNLSFFVIPANAGTQSGFPFPRE